MIKKQVPNVTFHTRVRDESVGGDNPYRWQDVNSDTYFKGKRVILFLSRERLHPLVQPFSFLILKNFMTNLKKSVLMKFTAFLLMIPS